MKIIFKLGYTEEDQLPRKSQYRTKQMIQLLEYLKSIPGEHLDKRCYRELSGGSSKEFYFQYPFVWYALIVGILAIGQLLRQQVFLERLQRCDHMKKYIRLMAGICLMIFIFTGCGNHTISKKTSKKEIDYDLVKMKYMQQFIRLMGIIINIADQPMQL